jgi:ATP-binding cassette subfamily B protein
MNNIQKNNGYSNLLTIYFKPQIIKYSLLFIIVAVGIGLQLYNPFLLRDFIDGALTGKKYETLVYYAVIYTCIALSHQFVLLYTVYLGDNLGWRSTNSLRANLASHYLQLSMSHQKKYTSGEVVERIDGDVNILQNFFSNLFVTLFGNMLLVLGILVLMFIEDWRVGLSLIIFTTAALFLLSKARKLGVPYFQRLRAIFGNFYGFITEYLGGIEDIRSNGGGHFVMKRFFQFLDQLLPALRAVKLSRYVLQSTSLLLFAIGNAIAFTIGAYLLSINKITIGTLFMIFHFTTLLIKPIDDIRLQLEDWQKADASINRINSLLDIPPTEQGNESIDVSKSSLSIEFNNVSFFYDTNQVGIRDISFHLKPNQKLGLLGRTGSGKTTLTRMLLRFEDPSMGVIKLGGIDIRNLNTKTLRKHIGIVSQDIRIFKTSLRNNLTLFDSTVTDHRIMYVIAELQLVDWFKSFTYGLDTKLLNEDRGLSAGEAQLISLIRVFVTDPKVLVLDEASSKLDPTTESIVNKATSRLLENRTAIIIAHRLTTIEQTDYIMILDKGSIIEYGERNQLIDNNKSYYYKLVNLATSEVAN